jgi:hypothetical protein
MVGIIITEDGQERNYVFSNQSYSKEPGVIFSVMFQVLINEKLVWHYQFNLSGDRALEFYSNWNTHAQLYELLCDEKGLSYDIIPDGIEGEA